MTIANYELYHAFERMFNPHNNNNNNSNNNINAMQDTNINDKAADATSNSMAHNNEKTNTAIDDLHQLDENNTHANTFMAMSGVL